MNLDVRGFTDFPIVEIRAQNVEAFMFGGARTPPTKTESIEVRRGGRCVWWGEHRGRRRMRRTQNHELQCFSTKVLMLLKDYFLPLQSVICNNRILHCHYFFCNHIEILFIRR